MISARRLLVALLASAAVAALSAPGCAAAPVPCPATFKACLDLGSNDSCDPELKRCPYPQGTCVCCPGSEWSGFPLNAGCPSPSPAAGATCSTSGLVCDYGFQCGEPALVCKDGKWATTTIPLGA